MPNYDFRNLLSAFEFECFSRDLLNAHENLDLSNFAEGPDKGIDLRCSSNKGNTVIVQAKRLKNASSLIDNLKKELPKVQKLTPQRYIITTTVDLSAERKDEILNLFAPYILSEHDIWAKQDLNKYLALHTDVELKYYKLWLASTNVLNSILNKNIVNWTDFEKEEIKETVRTYVMNDSFDDALSKLINNNYVVISGEPGIGKTTLARMLVMTLLSDKTTAGDTNNFEEFYYTSSNIDDFTNVFQTGKRQVFFYDDFMGRITLEEGEKNFDSRLVKFIKACQREKDKLLILTTREYILQQGLARYGRFNEGKGIEMSKCIVDMGKYTRFVRAQILYNHLVAKELPQEYINAILDDQNYLKLIDHPNFSPRIIETFLNNGTHEQCKPEEYFCKIKGYFDHPDSVWLDAFKRFSSIQKEALLVLATMGTPIMFELWEEAYRYFFGRVHRESNYLGDEDWNNAVKVLQNNFIRLGKSRDKYYVEFHNPGVNDVLTRYISDNESVRYLLLENACFIEQLFGVIREDGRKGAPTALPEKLVDHFFEVFERLWINFNSCRTSLYVASEYDKFYGRSPQSRAEILLLLLNGPASLLAARPNYVENKLTQQIMTDRDADFYSQIALLQKVDVSKTNLDLASLFDAYHFRLYNSDDCLDFIDAVKNVFPSHTGYVESKEFCDLMAECLKHDLEYVRDNDLDELEKKTISLCEHNPALEYEDVVSEISAKAKEYSEYVDAQIESWQDEYRIWRDNYIDKESVRIDNLFATIKES